MNWKAITDGLLGFVVSAGTSAVTLVAQGNVQSLSDVSEAAWFVAIVGAAVTSAKTVQSRLAPVAQE